MYTSFWTAVYWMTPLTKMTMTTKMRARMTLTMRTTTKKRRTKLSWVVPRLLGLGWRLVSPKIFY